MHVLLIYIFCGSFVAAIVGKNQSGILYNFFLKTYCCYQYKKQLTIFFTFLIDCHFLHGFLVCFFSFEKYQIKKLVEIHRIFFTSYKDFNERLEKKRFLSIISPQNREIFRVFHSLQIFHTKTQR